MHVNSYWLLCLKVWTCFVALRITRRIEIHFHDDGDYVLGWWLGLQTVGFAWKSRTTFMEYIIEMGQFRK